MRKALILSAAIVLVGVVFSSGAFAGDDYWLAYNPPYDGSATGWAGGVIVYNVSPESVSVNTTWVEQDGDVATYFKSSIASGEGWVSNCSDFFSSLTQAASNTGTMGDSNFLLLFESSGGVDSIIVLGLVWYSDATSAGMVNAYSCKVRDVADTGSQKSICGIYNGTITGWWGGLCVIVLPGSISSLMSSGTSAPEGMTLTLTLCETDGDKATYAATPNLGLNVFLMSDMTGEWTAAESNNGTFGDATWGYVEADLGYEGTGYTLLSFAYIAGPDGIMIARSVNCAKED